mgnify:CR=1 FL=1
MNPQQSHHCGIETIHLTLAFTHPTASSNRTIVGLKLKNITATGDNDIEQQSHHCGIETLLLLQLLFPLALAAIAPLWD